MAAAVLQPESSGTTAAVRDAYKARKAQLLASLASDAPAAAGSGEHVEVQP